MAVKAPHIRPSKFGGFLEFGIQKKAVERVAATETGGGEVNYSAGQVGILAQKNLLYRELRWH